VKEFAWVSLGAQYILEENNVIFGGNRAAALSNGPKYIYATKLKKESL
jgi:hypothetical protein